MPTETIYSKPPSGVWRNTMATDRRVAAARWMGYSRITQLSAAQIITRNNGWKKRNEWRKPQTGRCPQQNIVRGLNKNRICIFIQIFEDSIRVLYAGQRGKLPRCPRSVDFEVATSIAVRFPCELSQCGFVVCVCVLMIVGCDRDRLLRPAREDSLVEKPIFIDVGCCAAACKYALRSVWPLMCIIRRVFGVELPVEIR